MPDEQNKLPQIPRSEALSRQDLEMICKCGHRISKHLLIPVRVGQRERDRCTLCACRVFRQDASAVDASEVDAR